MRARHSKTQEPKTYIYYGRTNGIIPKKGVDYFMLEEHIQALLDKATDFHEKQLEKLRIDLKKDASSDLVKVMKSVQELSFMLVRLTKDFNNYKAEQAKPEVTEKEEIKKSMKAKGFKV